MLARPTGRERSQNHLRARFTGGIFLFVVEVESPLPDRADFARSARLFSGTVIFIFFAGFVKSINRFLVFSIRLSDFLRF